MGGQVFLKYGRSGSPHNKLVWMNNDLTKIFWTDPGSIKDPDDSKFLLVTDVSDVNTGRGTVEFQRMKQEDAFFDSLKTQEQISQKSFSIMGKGDRSLHLEAPNVKAAQSYMICLRFMLICKERIPETHDKTRRFIKGELTT